MQARSYYRLSRRCGAKIKLSLRSTYNDMTVQTQGSHSTTKTDLIYSHRYQQVVKGNFIVHFHFDTPLQALCPFHFCWCFFGFIVVDILSIAILNILHRFSGF